jgi:hypothetical protein
LFGSCITMYCIWLYYNVLYLIVILMVCIWL